jgi:hypothetical protein
MKDHRLIDERSRTFDRLIAEKLRANPSLVEKARGNALRWLESCSSGVRPALLEWLQVLDLPPNQIIAVLEAEDERSTRLRQSTPFCGILTEAERLAIIREFYERESNAT